MFFSVAFYLVLKHWVAATNLIKTGLRESARFGVSLAEPGIAARKL
jgi:hypothetical protein